MEKDVEDGVLIQIWVPNPKRGAVLSRHIAQIFGFTEVPELAEWHHPMGDRMDISPYDPKGKGAP